MQRDVGFLDLELLLGHAQIDAGLLGLDAPDEFVGGRAQARLFHVVARVRQIALVLVGVDARLRHCLIERGLRLRELRFLLNQLLLRRVLESKRITGAPFSTTSPLAAIQAMRRFGTMGA